MTTKIFIVEDHQMMQRILHLFISRMADFEICGSATDADQALAALPDAMPDLVLIDMSLPRINGAELVQLIRARWPELPCVLLSGHSEAKYVQEAMAAGARGYIVKGKPAELEPALQQISEGAFYLSAGLKKP